MPETVKTRSRRGSRRDAAPVTEAPVTEAAATTEPAAETTAEPAAADESAEVAVAAEATAEVSGNDEEVAATSDGAPVDAPVDVPEGVVGWADAVPWLALRWGSAPTAVEVRFALVVWRMLLDRPGRTALQMAADAELDGHTELDPTVLTRVLTRYERAGVVRAVTDGRLSWWSVVEPGEIVAQARESARVSAAAVRTGTRTVTARPAGGARSVAPAGGLRGMVEDHLAENPFEDFSPTQVAKALGRSSGAVANALERLVETGAAIQTSAAPRRYQHRPDPDAASAPGAAGTDGAADEAVTEGSTTE